MMKVVSVLQWGLLGGMSLCLISFPPLLDTVQSALIPGSESRDLDELNPDFQRSVEETLAAVRDQGWPVWVRATRRDAERQAFYKSQGFSTSLHSKHMRGVAVDINLPVPWVFFPLHVAFYRDLRDAAHANGLCSGADWHHPEKGRLLARFGLGWDPAHLQPC